MTDKKILQQYKDEKLAAQKVRQGKLMNWLKNEELYNGVVQSTLLTRSNLHTPKVFEGVQVVSARMGKLPDVDYDTKPEGDQNAADIMKAIWQEDSKGSQLEYLYKLSKTEAGIYGRPIFKLIPSNDGVTWDLIDTMSFLISPIAYTIPSAQYLGQDFIYKTYEQLEQEADSFGYDKNELKKVKKAVSEAFNKTSQEASQRNQRLATLGYTNNNQLGSKVVVITEWYHHQGKEKHVLTVANDEYILRDVKLEEIGCINWPFFSYGMFPRNVSFWTPSVADVLRDPNLALNVILNQIIDNNTYRNFGMIFASSRSGLPSTIAPRPLGVQKVTTDKSIKDEVWQYTPADLSNAQATFQLISGMAESAAGISFPMPGQRGKKTVSQMQQEQALIEQMTGQMKESALLCVQEMANEYARIMKRNLTNPRRVKVFGMKKLTIEGVTKDNFGEVEFIAKATAAETAKENRALKQKAKLQIYQLWNGRPDVNQKELNIMLGKEVGELTPGELEKLLTLDQQTQMQQMQMQNPDQAPKPGKPTDPKLPQNPDHSTLSQVQKQAQAGRV